MGEVQSALRAVEAAAILVDASSGIQVGTEKAWNACKKAEMPRFFIITKTDKENVDIDKTIGELQAKFGTSVATLDDRDALSEAIAEVDEELMDIYFDAGEFTEEQFNRGLVKGISTGDIAPVFCCSSVKGEGIKEILDELVKYVPLAIDHEPYKAVNGKDEPVEIKCDPNGKPVAFHIQDHCRPVPGARSLLQR